MHQAMIDLLYAQYREIISIIPFSGFAWLVCGSILAGIVRGFSGFGTAMVFLPFAGSVTNPVWALTILVVMDVIAPITLVPRTIKDTNPGELVMLGVGLIVAMPVGIYVLELLPVDLFRYLVSGLTILLLLMLIFGVRYQGQLSRPMVYGAGGLGGFFCGCVGLPGPPVIMLYLASNLPPVVIRANLFIYLIVADVLLLVYFGLKDILSVQAIILGIIVSISYLAALWLGSLLFNPEKEKTYRIAAYVIIAGSAITGLPLWLT